MENKKTVRWVFRTLKRFIPAVIAVSLLGALISFSTIALILVSSKIMNNAQAGITGNRLYTNIILLAIIFVFQLGANVLNGYLRTRLSGRINMYLKERLFSGLILKEYSHLSKLHSGEIVNRFTSDVEVVTNGFSGIIPSTVSIFTKLITGIGAVLMLDPLIALIIVLIGFIFPLFGRLISNKYKHMHKEVQRTNGVVRSFLQESIQNIVVIKTFQANAPIKQKLGTYLFDNFRIKIKRGIISVLTHTGLYGTFSLGYYGVLIWGALGIANGTVQYGTLFAFLELVAQLRNPLQSVSGLLPQYYSTLASAERLIELENLPDEAMPTSEKASNIYEKLVSINGESLSFGYDERDIIKNADFEIEKGSICAIMGESGKGKSTLFKLLLGLYTPKSGELFLKLSDNKLTLDASLRGLFSYVPQGDLVLSGTIRENITLLSGEVSEEAIEKAAKQAVIYDYISTLPDGFETVIGEHGLGLSEGQLQRIAIARALLTGAPILLLDECTSALDIDTERQLLENLKKESDRTVILITHRTAALDICDTVLTVENGKIKR